MPIDPKKIEEWKALAAAASGLVLAVKDKDGHPAGEGLILEFETARMEALRDLCREGVPALLSERKEMLELLRDLEWTGDPEMGYPLCVECGRWRPDAELSGETLQDVRRYQGMRPQGHAPDCRLAAFLKGAER